MKQRTIAAFIAVTILILLCANVTAEPLLIPVGETIGLTLRDNTVSIAAFDDILGMDAKNAGLKIGDYITKVDGIPVRNIEDIQRILEKSSSSVLLTLQRGSKEIELPVSLTPTESGAKLGLYLKQGITGIGTVTWYDPNTGKFGALGHGVNDSNGILLQMADGTAYQANVQSVTKGKCGHPGQLRGSCEAFDSFGSVHRNTPQGVFGNTKNGWKGEPLPIATDTQVHPGQACIRSTVSGLTPKDYSIEILKVYAKERMDGRNILLKVTDPSLLEETGGIVQGMSGSPILQDGRLVGAVTHVLVNDPTMGYGIFIENMLNAAA